MLTARIKASISFILNISKTEKSKIKLVPSSKYVVSAVAKQVKKTIVLPESMDARVMEAAHKVLEEGRVDVNIAPGKRTGAYSSGVIDSHPFILLNYSNTLDDVFTLAHEAGHQILKMLFPK